MNEAPPSKLLSSFPPSLLAAGFFATFLAAGRRRALGRFIPDGVHTNPELELETSTDSHT